MKYSINILIITLNLYKIIILIGSIARLALIIYFKDLFIIVVKEILKDKIENLIVIKGLVSR